MLCIAMYNMYICNKLQNFEKQFFLFHLRFTDDDKFFLRVAMMASKMSQDPRTQVGACLGRVIDKQERRIGGIGYNTMPRSGRLPWGKKTKYDYGLCL